MVLEETAIPSLTRPSELITSQPGGGSRWFIQRLPCSGSAAGRGSPTNLPRDSYQIRMLPASTSGNAKENAVTVTAAAAETATEEADGR